MNAFARRRTAGTSSTRFGTTRFGTTRAGSSIGHLGSALAVSGVTAAAALLASGSPASASSRATPADAPLDSAFTTSSGAAADLAMGEIGQVTNTFWELFVLGSTGSKWSLETPPGVADNGGLVSTTSTGDPLLAGFETSQDLGFSPLASTSSRGKSWQTGLVPSALARVPDALATSGHDALALLGPKHQVVDESTRDLSTWSSVVSERSLASSAAGRSCGLERLTAVAFSASGAPLVGGACSDPGKVGVFIGSGAHWSLATFRLPAGMASSPTTVLRLSSAGGSLVALVGTSGTSTALVAASANPSATAWTTSRSLTLSRGAALQSTSIGASGDVLVLSGSGNTHEAHQLTTPTGSWRQLASPPAKTAALAVTPAGRIDALAVAGASFSVYELQSPSGAWKRTQQIEVPIQYGSSG
jgi:hypothetical protein